MTRLKKRTCKGVYVQYLEVCVTILTCNNVSRENFVRKIVNHDYTQKEDSSFFNNDQYLELFGAQII